MEKHTQNLSLYLSSGGDSKLAVRYKSPTLANRAKITYLLSQLKVADNVDSSKNSVDSSTPVDKKETLPEPAKPKFLGLITQYPPTLHPSYHEAFSSWLNLCSLKLQLNEVPADDEAAAFEIETEMLRKLRRFDTCKAALDYYNDHKAILPTKSKRDFSKFSDLELDRERRNLESNISKRRKTISAKEIELPKPGELQHYKKLEALNKKRSELEELLLDLEKIQELLN